MIGRFRNEIELACTDEVGYAREFQTEETARAVQEMISDGIVNGWSVELFSHDDEDGWFITIYNNSSTFYLG